MKLKQPKINWRARAHKPTFWVAAVAALLVLVQIVGAWFGVSVPVEALEGEATAVINAVFMLLALLGIVDDPLTEGVGDSEQALKYDKPKAKPKKGGE